MENKKEIIKKITITLVSDLCTGTGETYNSLIDTDVVYDENGLPYIPAKRIKGCMREVAQEMADLNVTIENENGSEGFDEKAFNELFGDKGNKSSGFTLSNAYLKNHKDIINTINSWKGTDFVNQQAVLDVYTYTRTQTAVELATGVANDTSLRTMRVVKKGLTFEAECIINDKKYEKKLKAIISLVKHMGMARTRGLGLVEMRLEDSDRYNPQHVKICKQSLHNGRNKLHYAITLKSPMICKSAQGNQAETQDYIAGSKVLGIIAGALRAAGDNYQDFIKSGELVITNAYITHNDERSIVAPSSLQKKKDQLWETNNTMKIIDMRYTTEEPYKKLVANVQMTPVGITYMGYDNNKDSAINKVDISTEISYHHQRPINKSIGRATGESVDGSSFYQLCSVSAGQSFRGYIYASQAQAEQIIDSVSKLGQLRMGYGKSSEYGEIDFVIDGVESIEIKPELCHKAAVTLQSDMILYNKYGFLSTELSVLEEYLNDALGTKDIKIENPYLNFTTIGGYNVTWNARKPIFKAFAKGTSFFITSKTTDFDINKLNTRFIGERVNEGFGEVIASKCAQNPEIVLAKSSKENSETNRIYDDIIRDLMHIEFDRRLQKKILEELGEKKKEYKNKKEGIRAAVSKLRLMYKNENTYESMKGQVNNIKIEEKKKICLDLLKAPNELRDCIIGRLKTEYKLQNISEEDEKKIFPVKEEKNINRKNKLFDDVYRIYITELTHFVRSLDKEDDTNGK